MTTTMTGPIIGGAIAAVIGASCMLGIEIWREHRREKAIRKSMIEQLMAEIKENIKLSSEPTPGVFELDVWKSSLTKLSVLPAELQEIIRRACRKAEKRNRISDSDEGNILGIIGTQEIQNAFMLCRDKLKIIWMDSNIK